MSILFVAPKTGTDLALSPEGGRQFEPWRRLHVARGRAGAASETEDETWITEPDASKGEGRHVRSHTPRVAAVGLPPPAGFVAGILVAYIASIN